MLTKLHKLALVLAVLVLHLTAISPVKADEGLDLIIDEGLIVPWEINNIAPGSSGVIDVNIRNAGIISGYLAVWINGITDTEGENPEAETGNTEEPGELSQYLILNISGGNISPYTASPDFELPVALNEFPQSSSNPLQLSDQPLQVGGTIQLQWEWAIPPQTTNVIQGDSVSFNIHYILTQNLLVQKPSPSTSGGGHWPEGTTDYDTQDDDTSDVTEDTAESNVEADEQQATDTGVKDISDNTTIFYSEGTDMANDSVEVIPSSTDDDLKPTLPDSEDSQLKINLKNIRSTKRIPMQEILSQISLMVAVSGTLTMIILAYLERKRREKRHQQRANINYYT